MTRFSSSFSAQSKSVPADSAQERQSYTSTPAAGPSGKPAHLPPSPSLTKEDPPQGQEERLPADDLDSFLNIAKYLTDSEEDDDALDGQHKQKLCAHKCPKRLDDDLTILSRNDQQYDSADEGSDDEAAGNATTSSKVVCVFSPDLRQNELKPEVSPWQRQMKRRAGYQCEKLNDRGHLAGGPNEDICEKLEDLRSFVVSLPLCLRAKLRQLDGRYLEASGAPSAHWRQVGLQKALGVLRNSPTRIDTYDKAIAHKGIGGPTAEKIVEIVRTGELRRSKMMPLPEEKLAAPFRKVRLITLESLRSRLTICVDLWGWASCSKGLD